MCFIGLSQGFTELVVSWLIIKKYLGKVADRKKKTMSVSSSNYDCTHVCLVFSNGLHVWATANKLVVALDFKWIFLLSAQIWISKMRQGTRWGEIEFFDLSGLQNFSLFVYQTSAVMHCMQFFVMVKLQRVLFYLQPFFSSYFRLGNGTVWI